MRCLPHSVITQERGGEDIEEQRTRSSVSFMTHDSLLISAVRYEEFCHEQTSDRHRLPALNEQRGTNC
jgi:hypothetical protein